MTAEALAEKLEVSKRTIYRDIGALSGSGVPIYADGGPGGGYALLDSYRTTLNGLNQEEIRSLFLLMSPGPLADLGIDQTLQTAVLKLTSALPDRHYDQPEFVRQRFYLDAAGWFQVDEAVPHLDTIQEAVWSERAVNLSYRAPRGRLSVRIISPLGLVAKSGIWYVVASTGNGLRVYRISRITDVDWTDSEFERPSGFDLVQFWKDWAADYESSLPQYPVTLRVAPELVPTLPFIWGERVRTELPQFEADREGWRLLDYLFERKEEAEMRILGLGGLVEVVEPEELRTAVLKSAQDVVALYLKDK